MNIISAEEFNHETTYGQNREQKIYHNRVLVKGPVFALSQEKSAIKYYQVYCQKNSQSLCFLVRDKYYFQLWEEASILQNQQKTSLLNYKRQSITTEKDNTVSLPKLESPTLNSKTALKFTNLCQELLSQSIGPISKIVYKKILSRKDYNLSCQEFVKLLAEEIPDGQKSDHFKKTLLNFIDREVGSNTLLVEIFIYIEKDNQQSDPIENFDLNEIAYKMRYVGGLKIKNRYYNFKTYSNCFVGSEAVKWIKKTFDLSIEESIKLCQLLMDNDIIYHVENKKKFENKYVLYRFYSNEVSWD